MNKVTRLKGFGYLASIVSVLLLGAVALDSASDEPVLLVCLILGMAASVLGMALRWKAQLVQQRDERGQ